MQGFEKLKKLKEKMEEEQWKEKVEKQERDMKAYLKRSAAMKKSWAERKAKKDACTRARPDDQIRNDVRLFSGQGFLEKVWLWMPHNDSQML